MPPNPPHRGDLDVEVEVDVDVSLEEGLIELPLNAADVDVDIDVDVVANYDEDHAELATQSHLLPASFLPSNQNGISSPALLAGESIEHINRHDVEPGSPTITAAEILKICTEDASFNNLKAVNNKSNTRGIQNYDDFDDEIQMKRSAISNDESIPIQMQGQIEQEAITISSRQREDDDEAQTNAENFVSNVDPIENSDDDYHALDEDAENMTPNANPRTLHDAHALIIHDAFLVEITDNDVIIATHLEPN